MKFKTVLEGEQALVYNHLGEGSLLVGPQRVFLFRERLQKLKRYTASPYEYLVLKDAVGIVSHQQGPVEKFFNPMEYESIEVKEATKIDANHLIVVYKRLTNGDVDRRIIQGPTLFVPKAEEWLHNFCWHGTDPSNKTRMIPGSRSFNQLPIIPDQFYYNVREVRTVDDTMLTVKLMLFYEIKDILKMLDKTHDPTSDMINAVCADVISFAGKLSYEEFVKQTSKLSELDTYSQLQQRTHKIGFNIQKVVFRGYHASDQLQAMQNSAIESRTQLRLNADVEEQRQKITDFKLSKELERTKVRQDMEKSRQDHQQKVECLKQTHQMEVADLQHSQKLQLLDAKTRSQLEQTTGVDAHSVLYLGQLGELAVDLTKFLTSQQPPPVSEEIRVVSMRRAGLTSTPVPVGTTM